MKYPKGQIQGTLLLVKKGFNQLLQSKLIIQVFMIRNEFERKRILVYKMRPKYNLTAEEIKIKLETIIFIG